MTTDSKQAWSFWLTTIGGILTPGSGFTIPAGLPLWSTGLIFAIGGFLLALGNKFKHDISVETTKNVAVGAAIDRGEAVAPVSAAVLPTPVTPPVAPSTWQQPNPAIIAAAGGASGGQPATPSNVVPVNTATKP